MGTVGHQVLVPLKKRRKNLITHTVQIKLQGAFQANSIMLLFFSTKHCQSFFPYFSMLQHTLRMFYSPFNIIKVILRQSKGDKERHCAIKPNTAMILILHPAGFEPGSSFSKVRSSNHLATKMLLKPFAKAL